jgi:GDPmannose 4,6-dehydratase
MAEQKRALICGVTGQDGAYLAKLLLEKGYAVAGTSRDAQVANVGNLERLRIGERVQLESMATTDFRSVLQVISKVEPDELYYLAGQSSVGLSFMQPAETLESITMGTLNVLEAIRFTGRPVRLYNAASGECFGDTPETGANEETPFHPRSPYAVAKAAAFWEVANYREAYGLYACSGLLFNHESSLRPQRFVTQKVIAAVRRIAGGSRESLSLGNLAVRRDWGWAPEYVDAMWRMLQQDEPQDVVIATGEMHSLEEFVQHAFELKGLDWRAHVKTDAALSRPTDVRFSKGDAFKAKRTLDWRAEHTMREVVRKMLDGAL